MGIFGKYPDLQISNIAEVLIERNTYLHDHNSLLHDVAYPRRNKVQQYIDTSLGARLDLHRSLPYRLDTASHKVDVNFRGISTDDQSKAVEAVQADGCTLSARSITHRHYSRWTTEP